MGQGRVPTGEDVTIIERTAEPLPGDRAQLVERVWIDGEAQPELTVERGSPASAETVKRYEETIVLGDLDYEPACKKCGGVEVRRDALRIRRCADCGELLR